MEPGEELYEFYKQRARQHIPPNVGFVSFMVWDELRDYARAAWADLAHMLGGNQRIIFSEPLDRLLQRYGRHDMNCSTGGDCTCGFAEVEKRWKEPHRVALRNPYC
jgi:hypothetical protein